MDVVNTRADFGLEVVFLKRVEDQKIGTGSLEGDDVRVHVIDRRDDVRKFAVAHMRVDLCFRLDTAVNETECGDRPVEVFGIPVGLSQRELFAKCGFVDLDDADTVLFEIEDLVTDRQRDLKSAFLNGNIFTREGPVQDRYRTCEHALDRLVCAASGKDGPSDRDRFFSRDIAPDDRRLDAACAVGQDPCLFGKDVAGKVLAEVLDHVVSFVLAVNEHVEADLFLILDAGTDLFFVKSNVLIFRDRACLEVFSVASDVLGLREGADRRGREQRELEKFLLDLFSFLKCRKTCVVFVLDGADAVLYGLVQDIWAICEKHLVLFKSVLIRRCDLGKFDELFFRKREVRLIGIRELCLALECVRHVQK